MFQIVFYVGLALSIISLMISVILFVRNNVAKLMGDVMGWNTRRSKKSLCKVIADKSCPIWKKEHDIESEIQMEMLVGNDATILLGKDTSDFTERLSNRQRNCQIGVLEKALLIDGFFDVEESVIVTHTEECIDN